MDDLLASLGDFDAIRAGDGDPAITGVTQDSREVEPGVAFVAIPGLHVDGHEFLHRAAAAGAALLVVQRGRAEGLDVLGEAAIVAVDDTRLALAQLAAAFHGYPARDLLVVGITGTDGKTTTTHLTADVVQGAGEAAAFLSTAAIGLAGEVSQNDSHMTSPDPVIVQRFLADARDAGAKVAVIESSSHGIEQRRLDMCEFDVAAITNLASDHLDYHQTHERYREAKARLFDLLAAAHPKGVAKTAVLNIDDAHFAYFRDRCRTAVRTYGLVNEADVVANGLEEAGWQTRFRLRAGGREEDVPLPLPGRYNVSNALAAAAIGLSLGMDLPAVAEGLRQARPVPGRMERVETGREVLVVVDYAHTPQALEHALSSLRRYTRGRLIAVYGCTGDRDPGRRPGMGRIGGQLADYVVVTTEDTWTEDPADVMADVREGVLASGRIEGDEFTCIADRRAAIEHALAVARPGDTIAVTGMGHQQSMIVSGEKVPWDDREVIRELASRQANP